MEFDSDITDPVFARELLEPISEAIRKIDERLGDTDGRGTCDTSNGENMECVGEDCPPERFYEKGMILEDYAQHTYVDGDGKKRCTPTIYYGAGRMDMSRSKVADIKNLTDLVTMYRKVKRARQEADDYAKNFRDFCEAADNRESCDTMTTTPTSNQPRCYWTGDSMHLQDTMSMKIKQKSNRWVEGGDQILGSSGVLLSKPKCMDRRNLPLRLRDYTDEDLDANVMGHKWEAGKFYDVDAAGKLRNKGAIDYNSRILPRYDPAIEKTTVLGHTRQAFVGAAKDVSNGTIDTKKTLLSVPVTGTSRFVADQFELHLDLMRAIGTPAVYKRMKKTYDLYQCHVRNEKMVGPKKVIAEACENKPKPNLSKMLMLAVYDLLKSGHEFEEEHVKLQLQAGKELPDGKRIALHEVMWEKDRTKLNALKRRLYSNSDWMVEKSPNPTEWKNEPKAEVYLSYRDLISPDDKDKSTKVEKTKETEILIVNPIVVVYALYEGPHKKRYHKILRGSANAVGANSPEVKCKMEWATSDPVNPGNEALRKALRHLGVVEASGHEQEGFTGKLPKGVLRQLKALAKSEPDNYGKVVKYSDRLHDSNSEASAYLARPVASYLFKNDRLKKFSTLMFKIIVQRAEAASASLTVRSQLHEDLDTKVKYIKDNPTNMQELNDYVYKDVVQYLVSKSSYAANSPNDIGKLKEAYKKLYDTQIGLITDYTHTKPPGRECAAIEYLTDEDRKRMHTPGADQSETTGGTFTKIGLSWQETGDKKLIEKLSDHQRLKTPYLSIEALTDIETGVNAAGIAQTSISTRFVKNIFWFFKSTAFEIQGVGKRYKEDAISAGGSYEVDEASTLILGAVVASYILDNDEMGLKEKKALTKQYAHAWKYGTRAKNRAQQIQQTYIDLTPS